MDRILRRSTWTKIIALAGGARRPPLRAAIAYVGKNGIVPPRAGDVLICDASDQAIMNGDTDARILRRWHAKAEVRNLPQLHAKTALCGSLAIIGSSNWSGRSERDLVEATLVSDRLSVRSSVEDTIREFTEKSVALSMQDIKRLCTLPVRPRQFGTVGATAVREASTVSDSKFLLTSIDAGPRDVPDEERAKAYAVARRRAERPRLVCTEFTFPAGDTHVRELRPFDWMAYVDLSDGGRVVEPFPVLEVRKIGRLWLVVAEDRAWRRCPWKRFTGIARTLGLSIRSQRTHRYLSEHQAQLFQSAIDAIKGS